MRPLLVVAAYLKVCARSERSLFQSSILIGEKARRSTQRSLENLERILERKQNRSKRSVQVKTMQRKLYLMSTSYAPLLILLLLLNCFFDVFECTEIKWESAAKEGETDRAKIAPKSQRYWDEHNIERPDYAKTDAEVAAEAGKGSGLLLPLMGVVLVTFLLFAAHFWKYGRQFGAGQQLGSNDSSNPLARLFAFPSATKTNSAEERARQARLEHFEKKTHAKEE